MTARTRRKITTPLSDRRFDPTDHDSDMGGIDRSGQSSIGERQLRKIEIIRLDSLEPAQRNPRTHSKRQVRQIASSIEKFGFNSPILIDKSNRIVAGHGRYEAAKHLGHHTVPIIRLDSLNNSELRAYALADNKIAQNAGWDRELLALEFEELQLALPEVGLDLEITGFSAVEVDGIISDFSTSPCHPADEIPELSVTVTSKTADIFILDKHRLAVGDVRDEKCVAALMLNDRAEMAFLDPPYNVRIDGHAGGRGKTKHREFAFASGEMSSAQFTRFLQDTLGMCARHTSDGAIHFVCMDWRHAIELLEAGASVYGELKNMCVWTKTTPGQGSFYRSQHELVFVYKHGTAPHINTFELGQYGRTRSNVWNYPGANTFRAGRMDELKMHPTVKPVAMIIDAMKDCSHRGGIVLDSFCGSGSTIIAAEQVGRRAHCIEIDPRYVDVAIRRWQRLTGKDAILESSGETFDDLVQSRLTGPTK